MMGVGADLFRFATVVVIDDGGGCVYVCVCARTCMWRVLYGSMSGFYTNVGNLHSAVRAWTASQLPGLQLCRPLFLFCHLFVNENL